MKEIKLTRGLVAIVDDADFTYLNQFKWAALPYPQSDKFRARRGYKKNGRVVGVYMHREIMNPLPDFYIDHINGNGLDNRRSNLRITAFGENIQNRKIKNISGFTGVNFQDNPRRKSKYFAQINKDKKIYSLGYYLTAELAAEAYDRKALELYGKFAHLNFPENREKYLTISPLWY